MGLVGHSVCRSETKKSWTTRLNVLASTVVLILAMLFILEVSANDTEGLSMQSIDSSNSNLSDSSEFVDSREDFDTDSREVTIYDDDQHWLNSAEADKAVLESEDDHDVPLDCCPTRRDLSYVNSTRNIRGESVLLYRSDDIKQQFLEVSCKDGVAGSPCRFMGKPISNKTKCVQRYSFSYALVLMVNKTLNESRYFAHNPRPIFPYGFDTEEEQYMLDHVRIRSGCTCQLDRKKIKDDILIKKTKNTKLKHKKKTSTS